jgi:CRP/FNR family cyclic AMP-dependent transcriptional regulator
LAHDFRNLDPTDAEEYGPGEILFTQGETTPVMYLVLEGEIALKSGGETVEVVKEGDVLGEMSLIERSSQLHLAEAVGDVRVHPVDRRLFETMVIQDPEFARNVLRTMGRRLRRTSRAVLGLAGEPPVKAGESTSRVLLAMKGMLSHAQGATIFREGDKGDRMFLVQEGAVELRMGGTAVMTVEAGGFFGEMALIEDAPRSASAHAATDCKLMPVDRARFEYLIRMTPDFVLEMMRTMAQRTRAMHQRPTA